MQDVAQHSVSVGLEEQQNMQPATVASMELGPTAEIASVTERPTETAESRPEAAENAVAGGDEGKAGPSGAELGKEVLHESSTKPGQSADDMSVAVQRLKADLVHTTSLLEGATTARSQLSKQLEEANKQLARGTASAAAAEERLKAELQQMQVRLAASEAKCRSLQQANATLQEDVLRAQKEAAALQGHVLEERRLKEDQANECRRLQRDLDAATEGLVHAQRAQRSSAANAAEMEVELEGLRAARSALESELQAASARVLKSQEETRDLAERNAELARQLRETSATVRQLEAENTRLVAGNAELTAAVEARAAEARTAREEVAELAAQRTRLVAEMRALRGELEQVEASRVREALSETRREVSRLQAELAANDRVLADAEAALLSLVADRDSLEQQVNAARQAERRAADAAEALRTQVATLQTQLGAVLEGPLLAKHKASGATTGAVVRDRVAVQRMADYLQVLSVESSKPRPSGGSSSSISRAASLSRPTGTALPPPTGPEPSSSDPTAAAIVSVPSAKHYPAAAVPPDAGVGLILSTSSQGPVEVEAAKEDSALRPYKSMVEGAAAAAAAASPRVCKPLGGVMSLPAATRAHSDTTEPRGALTHTTPGGTAAASPSPAAALVVGKLESPPHASSLSHQPEPAGNVAPVAGDAVSNTTAPGPSKGEQTAATSSLPLEGEPSVASNNASPGQVGKPLVPLPAVPAAAAAAAAVQVSDGIPQSGSPSTSPPSAVTRRRAATERAGSNTRQSLERLIEEMNAQPSASSVAAQEAATKEEADVSSVPPVTAADTTSPSATTEGPLPDPVAQYPPDSTYAGSSHGCESPEAMSSSQQMLSAESSAGTGAEAAEPSTPIPAVQQPFTTATPVPPVPAYVAETTGLLHSSASLAPLVTPRSLLSASRLTASLSLGAASDGVRSSGLVAGGSGTVMISPRNMLEGRMLTRAVRQVADALARPSSVGGVLEAGSGALWSLPLGFSIGEEQLASGSGALTSFQGSTSLLSPLPSWRQAAAQQLSSLTNSPVPAGVSDLQPVDRSGCSSAAPPSPTAPASVASTDLIATMDAQAPLPVPFAAAPNLAQMAQRISTELNSVASSGLGALGGVVGSLGNGGSIRANISLPMASSQTLAASQTPVSRGSSLHGSPFPEVVQEYSGYAYSYIHPAQRRSPLQPASPIRGSPWDRMAMGMNAPSAVPPAAPEDDTGSLLAQRLAAMDEALRAIGAI
ncbi:hypothetical protein Agub_g1739 [Astrephomene gubernaculifera]|uniref:Uncharacterized protein n=1 Tax=Astrephomene gubernaculifera TaxID=47775 RepID=A0AAD3DFZ7_9CHLO|nr:hypothetical protein Agub_g1739 [Astrephomene gubernaculifera]